MTPDTGQQLCTTEAHSTEGTPVGSGARSQVLRQHRHHFRACFPVSFFSLVTSLFIQSGTRASENCQAYKKWPL